MMNGTRFFRKLVAVGAAVLFLSAGAAASQQCEEKDSHYGLSCNDGGPITICEGLDGCTAQCGDGPVVDGVTC